MRSRSSASGLARQFQTDIQTLTCGRLRGGPSIGDRVIALDRIAGSTMLVCVAGLAAWLVVQALPAGELKVPTIAESAEAAPSGATSPDLQKAGAAVAAEPMNATDIRRLQIRLQRLGFSPGPIDGIVGGRTLEALNSYRATKQLTPVFEIDHAAAADLLN
jgi:putative peptidoglycan binding protein